MTREEGWVEDIVAVDGRDLTLLRPREPEALLDEETFVQRDEFLPYWADLWPSAGVLARTVARRVRRGRRVLELGCGLGLPSLAAALAGARPLATDWAPEALDALRVNAARNDLAVGVLVADWRDPWAITAHGPFDLVIAADVLYEERNVAPLVALLGALGTEAWLADPGRPPCAALLETLAAAGWTRCTLAETAVPRVCVHRLRPGRMS